MKSLRALGMVWVFPVAIFVWAFYLLPAWALGWLAYDGVVRFGVIRFHVVQRDHWYSRAWASWGGFAAPYAILINSDSVVTELHELRHTDQWLVLGPLFPFVYLLWLGLCGYVGHPFERDARNWARREWNYHLESQYKGARS